MADCDKGAITPKTANKTINWNLRWTAGLLIVAGYVQLAVVFVADHLLIVA